MNKIDKLWGIIGIAFALAFFPVVKSLATCTYTTTAAYNNVTNSYGPKVSVASCNEITEARPTSATAGASLVGVKAFDVSVVASGNMTAGSKLLATKYLPVAAKWIDAPDLDVVVSSATTNQVWPGFVNTVPEGRIAYRPSAIGAAGTNTIIYISLDK